LRENELATLRSVVYEPIPSPSKYNKVDGTLEAIIMCALDRNPDERFQTAEEMRVALEKWTFAAGGTSTHDLSQLMKAWFPTDHVQWQRAARLALDMQESDPPIDLAFPNLASRSGYSRTGTSKPEGLGWGPKLGSDSFSSPINSDVLPGPHLAPATPPKTGRYIAIAFLLAGLAAGGVLGYPHLQHYLHPQALPTPTPVSEIKVAPARPTVETLPPESKPQPAASDKAAPAQAAEPAHAPAIPSADDAAKKRHAAALRAAAREHELYESPAAKRPNSYEDKSTSKKPRDFRPNPF
jgi:hypothetical protein